MDLTLGLLVVRATKKEGRSIESAFAPRATRNSLRVNRERRLVEGAGLEPAASALRTLPVRRAISLELDNIGDARRADVTTL